MLGKILLTAFVATAGWKTLGPTRRQKIWTFLEEAAAAAEQRRQEEERQRWLRQMQLAFIAEESGPAFGSHPINT